jgi:hypothetical protein
MLPTVFVFFTSHGGVIFCFHGLLKYSCIPPMSSCEVFSVLYEIISHGKFYLNRNRFQGFMPKRIKK